MFDEDAAVLIAKIGGPICLFICTPVMAVISYSVVMKDKAAGVDIMDRTTLGIVIVNLLMLAGSVYVCRYGLGWFGGKK